MASAFPLDHGVDVGDSDAQASRSGCNDRADDQDPSAPTRSAKLVDKTSQGKKVTVCRFFAAKKGCRAGDKCPYLHDVTTPPTPLDVPHRPAGQASAVEQAANARQIVSKPVPNLQKTDPRKFEIKQLEHRYHPSTTNTDNATALTFKLVPTDPDFPFELDGLQCNLTVPAAYPKDARPSLRVMNPEMERGYQINVERGFDSLATHFPTKTLLGLINELDKNLESFLTSEKAQTIKIVPNAMKRVANEPPEPAKQPSIPSQVPLRHHIREFSHPAKAAASERRQAEVQQLIARLGRHPLFSKSADHSNFTLPLQTKTASLPPELQLIKTIRLRVPQLYNLEPCTVLIDSSPDRAARTAEMAFEKHARSHPEMTLMAHVNYLSQNLSKMAIEEPIQPVDNIDVVAVPEVRAENPEHESAKAVPATTQDEGRPHIIVIPRPPEWDHQVGDSGDEDSSDLSDSEHYDTEDDEDGGAPVPESSEAEHSSSPERGVMISFPRLEMYGIELLELSSLSVTVKCDRCKEVVDVKNVLPSTKGTSLPAKSETCKKCASVLGVAYRGEPMHVNSVRAGYLDLEGCLIVDMLPSSFHPTCSECSTTFTASPVVSVRGETSLAICRECHKKMTFKLPEVKFLRVSNDAQVNRPLPPRRRPKETLGLVAGTELPSRGRCSHYAKSYRWFRFGCCGKVYACDRCHDAKEEHPNEHAGRMICGWCSREQIYRPEECGSCGRSVVGRKGGGFWEGGRGTRDKVRMSRKDPRKWKRRGGTGTPAAQK